MNPSGLRRPLLVYDGSCPFCVAWMKHWRGLTGASVDYASCQTVAGCFPRIPPERFRQSVHLILPDGSVHTGARAVFTILAHAGRGRRLLAYQRVPGFTAVAEAIYRGVARGRGLLWKLCRFAAGASARRRIKTRPGCCA